MVATFVPSPLDRPGSGPDGARPHLRLIEGGAGAPATSRSVYLRRRVLAFLLMVACVVAVAVGAQTALRSLVASPGGGASIAPGVTQSSGDLRVQPGDTLWSIAAGVTPAGEDIRATVDRLVEANGGSALVVGQQLVLPD